MLYDRNRRLYWEQDKLPPIELLHPGAINYRQGGNQFVVTQEDGVRDVFVNGEKQTKVPFDVWPFTKDSSKPYRTNNVPYGYNIEFEERAELVVMLLVWRLLDQRSRVEMGAERFPLYKAPRGGLRRSKIWTQSVDVSRRPASFNVVYANFGSLSDCQ